MNRRIGPDLPRATEAERALLASVMMSPIELAPMVERLKDDHFLDDRALRISRAIVRLHRRGQPADLMLVHDELAAAGDLEAIGGRAELAEFQNCVATASLAESYYVAVEGARQRRHICLLADDALRAMADGRPVDETLTAMRYGLDYIAKNGASPKAIKYRTLKNDELLSGDFTPAYYVREFLVKGQPCGLFAPSKSLKTTLVIALAVALVSGRRFLDVWEVVEKARVGIMSGESGLGALQNAEKRIIDSYDIDPAKLRDGLVWTTDLPIFGSAPHMEAMREWITENGVEVAVIDPAYMCLGASSGDAANVFEMGMLLRSLSELCQSVGCTVVILHHAVKSIAPGTVPELQHAAFAGWSEFVRQWILLNRYLPYDPDGNGEHRLWMSYGGSSGHSGLVGLDIEEGRSDSPGGRYWRCDVRSAADVRADLSEGKGAEKALQKEAAMGKDVGTLMAAVDALKGPQTKAELLAEIGQGWGKSRIMHAVAAAKRAGLVLETLKAVSNQKTARTPAYYRNPAE